MAKWAFGCLGRVLFLGVVLVGCSPPEDRKEPVTEKKSALVINLFTPYVTYPTGSRAEAVAIGDLDGDGRIDAAIVTGTSSDLANDHMLDVFLQASDGTFRPMLQYVLNAPSPRSLDIGDVNGDGRADVVVGNPNGAASSVDVLLQNASGTLDAAVSYAAANADQVKIGDFNGDGRMDVAGLIAGSGGDGLDVLLQTPTGTLAAPVTYHVAHGLGGDLDAGDVNGDGRTDLVVSPGLSVLLQNTDGTMAAPVTYSAGGGATLAGSAVGDSTDDGRADVVVSYNGSPTGAFIARLLQNGQGTLAPAVTYGTAGNPGPLVVADVDPDGRKDILVLHKNSGQLGVYQQGPGGGLVLVDDTVGSSTPYERRSPIPITADYGPQALAVGDINNDGFPDVLIADRDHGLVVLRHTTDRAPTVAITAPTPGIYPAGQPINVTWTASTDATGFGLLVSFNGGASYGSMPSCSFLPATARNCTWAAPSAAATGVRILVQAWSAAGTEWTETIVDLVIPSVSVTAPVANASWSVGAPATITWSSNLPPSATVRVELTRDFGITFETLAAAAPNTGSFTWTVTGPVTSWARVRVTLNSASSTSGVFSINLLTVTSPVAGAPVYIGQPMTITWTSNLAFPTSVRIELSLDGGTSWGTMANSVPDTGTFTIPLVAAPPTTNARVRVTTLGQVTVTGTSGAFTLVTSVLTVTSPVAGASAFVGAPLALTWTHNYPANGSMRVELSRDGGGTYTTLAASAPDTGNFAWTVTGPATANARLRLTAAGSTPLLVAQSGTFAIVAPAVTVTGPGAGATAFTGAPVTITWTHNLPGAATALIELSRDGGASFETLAAAAPNTGSFAWTASGPDTATALARVTLNGPPTVSGTSGAFAIVTPMVAVTGPSGGASAFAGTPVAITWTHNMAGVATALIELSRDGGASFETLADAAPNTGNFAWIASGPDTATALVRVTLNGPPAVSGASGLFGIVSPMLSVGSPAAGASYFAGSAQTITWSTNLPANATMLVELSRDGGGTFETLATAAPNTGSFAWTVTGPPSATARVRVSSSDPVAASATSGVFGIVSAGLTVTGPAAGASWLVGTSQAITWTTNLPASDTVRVELSRDGGSTYTVLAASAPNTGSFAWTATTPAATSAVVRVTGNGAVSASGVSGVFAIASATLTVTAPGTGAAWAIGTAQAITWSSNLPPTGTVKVELSRNNGTSYTVLAASAPNSGSFAWTVTSPATTTARVRVSSNGTPAASAVSATFSLVAATVTVTSPNTLVTWLVGSVHAVTWTHNVGTAARFKIEVSRNSGSTWSLITASAAPGGATSGSYNWTVASPKSDTCRIRVTWTGNTAVNDASNTNFRIR